MKLPRYIALSAMLLLSVASLDAKPQKFAIGLSPVFFEPQTSEVARMLWLIYANARVTYAETHPKKVVLKDGRVVPSLEDEVSARRETVSMYKRMKKEKPEVTDAYWDQLERIDDAGLMSEYVWECLRQPTWKPAVAPPRLSDFAAYREKELQGHVALTLASVTKG